MVQSARVCSLCGLTIFGLFVYFRQSSFLGGSDADPLPSRAADPDAAERRIRNALTPTISCRKADSVVIYVLSTRNATGRRDVIRRTWGDVGRWNRAAIGALPLALFFVVGAPCPGGDGVTWSDHVTRLLLAEGGAHGDLLLAADADDCYGNLTNKDVSALTFIKDACPPEGVAFVFKTDDDVFVNVPRLVRLMDAAARAGSRCHFLCNVMRRVPVPRDGKWAVPVERYPRETLPFYCQGLGYAICRDGLRLLYENMPDVDADPFPLEDVFMTSLVLRGNDSSDGTPQLAYRPIKHKLVWQARGRLPADLERYVMIHQLPLEVYEDLHESIMMGLDDGDVTRGRRG